MPLIPIAIAFVAGGAAGAYAMSDAKKIAGFAALGAGAYWLYKRGG